MKAIFKYIKKTISWLNKLSKDENLPLCWVYLDYARAVIGHRCLIRQYVIGEFFKKSNPERKKCLTYNRIVKLFDKYNQKEYIHFLKEKPDFNAYFKNYVKREWLHIENTTEQDFINFVQKHDTVIIKPINGVEGEGIRKFVLSKNPNINLQELFTELKKENVLIEQVIIPNRHMVFGNTSVNTIRTHTFLDKNGKAHVIKAILRAGVGDSVVDNYAQGGSIYEVDLQTGVVCSRGKSKAGDNHIIHPGTDIVMLGYRIPNWNQVMKISRDAAEHLPQIGFIGWDVAIAEDYVELIEGNHNPDYELLEYLGSNCYYEKIIKLMK